MARYTKKDADGRYYIESVNGKLESDKFGHTYGEAIDRFAELENADVAPRAEVAREIFEELTKSVISKLPMKIRLIFKDDRNYDDGFRDGKGDALIEVLVLIDDLKKKYTEGQK